MQFLTTSCTGLHGSLERLKNSLKSAEFLMSSPQWGCCVSINLVDNLRLISVCHSSQRHKNVCRLLDWQGTEAKLPTACSEGAHPSNSSYQDSYEGQIKREFKHSHCNLVCMAFEQHQAMIKVSLQRYSFGLFATGLMLNCTAPGFRQRLGSPLW